MFDLVITYRKHLVAHKQLYVLISYGLIT